MAKTIQRTQIWFDEKIKNRKEAVGRLRPKTGWQELMEIGLEYLEYKHGIKK